MSEINEVQEHNHFLPGEEVMITEEHLLPAYRGDTGKIERLVGFEKYYVFLKKHGKTMVHEKHLKKLEK